MIVVRGPTRRRITEIDDETNDHASFMGLDERSFAATLDRALKPETPARQKAFRGDAQEDTVIAHQRREAASYLCRARAIMASESALFSGARGPG